MLHGPAPTLRSISAGQVNIGWIVSKPSNVAVQVVDVVPDASTALIVIVVASVMGIMDPAAGVWVNSGVDVQLSDAV